MQPRRCQPGGNANGVLLGYTDFDETLGITYYIVAGAKFETVEIFGP
jgi:hypothetical protein